MLSLHIFHMDEVTGKSEESINPLVKRKRKEKKQWSLSNWEFMYPIAWLERTSTNIAGTSEKVEFLPR